MPSWISTTVKFIVFFCLIFVQIPAFSDAKSDKMKVRLEQLFLWKVSDRLQLTPKEEDLFVSEFKKISDQKAKLAIKADGLWEKIEANKADKKKAAIMLKEYLELQSKLNTLQLKDVQAVEKLFGSSRAAEYLLAKHEMTQKMRDVLTNH